MGPQTARLLLTDMLARLSASRWWILYEKKPNDMGISKALSIYRADVEALLINAGLYKKTPKGVLHFQPKIWHIYEATLPEDIHICSIRKNVWYVARGPLIHATPGE